MTMEIKFNCIVLGNHKEKIAEYTEWLDGDGWKNDFYAPLVTNGVFDHRELGDGWLGEIIRRRFVGLTDKNGKEIYEKDIVQTPVSKSVVEFSHGVFGLNHDYGTNLTNMLGSWGQEHNLRSIDDGYNREIEVIGNVIENTELLHNK